MVALTDKQLTVLDQLLNDGIIFASNHGCFSPSSRGIPKQIIEALEDKGYALFHGIGGADIGCNFTSYWTPTSAATKQINRL